MSQGFWFELGRIGGRFAFLLVFFVFICVCYVVGEWLKGRKT